MSILHPRPRSLDSERMGGEPTSIAHHVDRSRDTRGSSREAAPAPPEGGRAVDTLSLLWLTTLTLLGLARNQPVAAAAAAGLAGATLLAVRWSRRHPALGFVHAYFPVVVVFGSFLVLGPLIERSAPRDWDAVLAGIDARAFAPLARAWRGLLGRPSWLVDLASLGYVAFYVLPLAMAAALRRQHRRAELDDFFLQLATTFFLSFCGYLLVPALGPRPADGAAVAVVGGGAISETLRALLALAERTRWDAFPSGHTAIAVICAASAPALFGQSRRSLATIVGVAATIVFATVYLHLHYVVDIVAGLALAAAVILYWPWFGRLLRALPRLQTGSPGAGVVPLFCRADGDLVPTEAPVRRILPYLMRGRNESAVVHAVTYDVSRTLPWLVAYNAHNRQRATMFDLYLYAIARALHTHPGLNRFVSGGRVYQRRGVFLSFAVKPRFDEQAPLVAVKVEIPAGANFPTAVRRIHAATAGARGGERTSVDRELRWALALPGTLLRGVMAILRGLDRFNLLPASLTAGDPMYGSVFAANLGSLGFSHPSHHLYEYGTASVFGAMGRVEKTILLDPQGRPAIRDGLSVRWTFDERIQDGFACALALATVAKMLEHPAAELGPVGTLPPARAVTPSNGAERE